MIALRGKGYDVCLHIPWRKRLALRLLGWIARWAGLKVTVDFRLAWDPPVVTAVKRARSCQREGARS